MEGHGGLPGRGALFAFANNSRPLDQVLLRNIFDNGTRCGINEDMDNRVCLSNGGTVKPWVPWMSGQWNPFEACDIQMVQIDQGHQGRQVAQVGLGAEAPHLLPTQGRLNPSCLPYNIHLHHLDYG